MKEFLRNIKLYLTYYRWNFFQRNGIIPHILHKRKRLLEYGKAYDCKTFIETGTHEGRTVKFLRNGFKKVMSVEVYKPCYEVSLERTKPFANIELFFGDSKVMLPQMAEKIEGRALFWLDGHFSGKGTGKAESNCPVIHELDIIKKLKRNDHLILVDDAREFNGTLDYPKLEVVIAKLKEINPDYKIEVIDDCIMALPKNITRKDN